MSPSPIQGEQAVATEMHSDSEAAWTAQAIPGKEYPNAFSALQSLASGARSISAAVAFVTEPGVRRIAEVLRACPDAEVELVARASDVTTPEALLRLRDELGVDVSVVIGQGASSFHPKLWLIRSDARLAVLSGSGNLTDGGLLTNDEQFELFEVPLGSEAAHRHEERFDTLTARAASLDDVVRSPIWSEWLSVIKKQENLRRELQKIASQLASREVKLSRAVDKRVLLDDLDDLYGRTVEAELTQRDGRRYVPSRFKQGIERVRAGGDPVLLVTRICRRQTDGFNVILDADRPDLTVEILVVDGSKPYHDLFTESTVYVSADRLLQFPSWPPTSHGHDRSAAAFKANEARSPEARSAAAYKANAARTPDARSAAARKAWETRRRSDI